MVRPFFFLLLLGTWAAFAQAEPLRVYTYDSLVGKDSLGELIGKEFQNQTGIPVQFVTFSTAGEALNQVLLEYPNTKADLLMGIDQLLFLKVKDRDLFEPFDESNLKNVDPLLRFRGFKSFAPFDYGYLAFIYDSLRTEPQQKIDLRKFPQTLADKKIVIQDPRTSTLGIELVVWTAAKLGSQFELFWKEMAPKILTISPGWSGAYELFIKKQADYVLSYTTSPAYHHMRENKKSIKALLFEDGHFRQIEGLSIMKTSKLKSAAKRFVEIVLSQNIQQRIPTVQWMYPARSSTALPSEFKALPIPKQLDIDWNKIAENRDDWVKTWTLILSKEKK